MKYIIVACLCLCACASTKVQPATVHGVKVEACDKLWAHNLVLALQQTDDSAYYAAHPVEALNVLDRQLIESGMKGRFYSYCSMRMTPEQADCSMRAEALVEENLCQ